MKSWMMAIMCVSIITCIAMNISPEGRTKSAVRFVCSLTMMLALLSPIARLDMDSFRGGIWRYRNEAMHRAEEIEKTDAGISRLFIQEECESYIMKKGTELGADIGKAKVSMRWSEDGYWYPVKAEIVSPAPSEGDDRLKNVIISELGIEDIEWEYADESRNG